MDISAARIKPVPLATGKVDNQVAKARAGMTELSNSRMPDSVLRIPVADTSVAGALNEQIRFRLQGDGPPSARSLVPDTKLAAQLVASTAGPSLLKQFDVALKGAGAQADLTHVKGFILAPDTTAIVAADLFTQLDNDPSKIARFAREAEKHPDRAKAQMQKRYDRMEKWSIDVGGWNEAGWITMMPDTSRAMLVAAGAYHPAKSEPDLRHARKWSNYLEGVTVHEVQHSVSPATDNDYTRLTWLEEGIAGLFSESEPVRRPNSEAMGVSEQSYAGHLGTPSLRFDPKWGAYVSPKHATKKEADAVRNRQNRDYDKSRVLLDGLSTLAGAPLTTAAGLARAREIFQGQSIRYVPGRLADAIITHNHLDPSVRERLREHIIASINQVDPVDSIANDFGIRH